MGKLFLKIIACLGAVIAALAALAYFEKTSTPEYIEIYSDNDDENDAFCRSAKSSGGV